MDKVAADAAVATLESSIHTIDFLALVCGIFVAIFLAGEIWFIGAHWLKESTLKPLRERQAQLNELELQRLRNETAKANERTAEIMKATAWRQFTPDQIAKLTAVLSNHSGKYVAAWIANDPESLVLALQFINLLASFDGKWDMVNSAKVYPTNAVWDVHIPDVPSAGETVQIMRDAFTQAGIHFWTEAPPEAMSYGVSDSKVLEGRAIVALATIPMSCCFDILAITLGNPQ